MYKINSIVFQWLVIVNLGLSSNQGAGQQSAGGGNPMAGMAGLNIGALPMNPALVAAALNQAGWGILGANLGAGGGGPGGGPAGPGAEAHGGFPTPTSFSTHANVTTTPVLYKCVSMVPRKLYSLILSFLRI